VLSLFLRAKAVLCCLVLFAALGAAAHGAEVARVELEKGAVAAIMDGRVIVIELTPPKGGNSDEFFARWINDAKSWKAYRNLKSAAVPYNRLTPAAQRRALEVLFPKDYVDAEGWWHTVTYSGPRGAETLFNVAEWLTGKGTNFKEILSVAENRSIDEKLQIDEVILVPKVLLLEVMKTPTPKRPATARARAKDAKKDAKKDIAIRADALTLEGLSPPDGMEDLIYGEDAEGKYAEYRLKPGETVYSDVVVRFTDFHEHADVQDACDVVLRRSGVKDASQLKEGQRIRLPLEMISSAYQPSGTVERKDFEDMRAQAKVLKGGKETLTDLKGVVIVLDPGHGGRDKGAMNPTAGLYEDELTYDIVVRLKQIIETKSQAKVYMTMKDPDQGFTPSKAKRFYPDEDEFVMTTPPYVTEDARISAALRWYLANDIYRKSLKAGVKDSRMLFLSVHCDSLFNAKVRGSMVYVPSAAHRDNAETVDGDLYNNYAEAKGNRVAKSTATQRKRDEALSYNFANAVIAALNGAKKPAIKVHGPGDPIRNVIRQKGGKVYVPAVLRANLIPTKVLVETANITNPTDRANLADPAWRQAYADALYVAIINHFGG